MIQTKNIKRKPNHLLDDKKISIALMSSFVILTIQYFILIYFDLLGEEDANVQLVSKALVGMFFLYALIAVFRRSKIKFLLTYSIATFVYILNYLIFPNNSQILTSLILSVFFMCIPAFIYSMSIVNVTVLKKITKKASFIIFLCGTLIGLLSFTGNILVGSYSMSLSYYMLLPAIIYLDDFFEGFSYRSLLVTSTSILIILSLGSRGALLCIIVFTILRLFRYKILKNYARTFYFLFTLTIISFMFIFYDSILVFINKQLINLGINSRSIQLLLMDNINLSGRESIYQHTLNEIIANPIIGIGIGGDRHRGGYVHNILLEIIANFGLIIGLILIIFIIIIIIRALLIKNIELYRIVITWISVGFIPYLLSSSYLIDLKFWIFLGLLINIVSSNKIKDIITNDLDAEVNIKGGNINE